MVQSLTSNAALTSHTLMKLLICQTNLKTNLHCENLKKKLHFGFLQILGIYAFSALTLLVGRQEGHPACKKTEWWGGGMVICLERGADLHTA